MQKCWYRLNFEVEMRKDFKLPEPQSFETWYLHFKIENILTEQWLKEYKEILKINKCLLFFWHDNYTPEKVHIDWRRRWAINWVMQDDNRELTWYPEVPTKYYEDVDIRLHDIYHTQKENSHLAPIDPNAVQDRLCFDGYPMTAHFLKTDIPHHVGIGKHRWGFSLSNSIEWDIPFDQMLEHYRKHNLIIER